MKTMKTKENKEKCYNVSRYFDDMFEGIVARDLTKEDAQKKAQELNDFQPRAYVEYIVRQIRYERL